MLNKIKTIYQGFIDSRTEEGCSKVQNVRWTASFREYENLLTQILSMISMAKHLKNLHALLDNQLHILN